MKKNNYVVLLILFVMVLLWGIFWDFLYGPHILCCKCYKYDMLVSLLGSIAIFIEIIFSLIGIIIISFSKFIKKNIKALLIILLIISIVVPRLLIFSTKYIHDHDTEVSCWKPIETGGYKSDKNNQ